MGKIIIILKDINKCAKIAERKIHSQSVNIIGNYVDYTFTNLYYTVSKDEKRIVFSDLRTNKNIKIINGLASIKNVLANESGRFFIVN